MINSGNKDFYKSLADYFASMPLYLDGENFKKPNIRKLVEQPWQQIKAEMWDEIEKSLSDFIFLMAKCNAYLVFELLDDFILYGNEMDAQKATNPLLVEIESFLRKNSNVINEYPDIFLQNAANEPSGSEFQKIARNLLKTTLISKPWLDWTNQPINSSACILTLDGHLDEITGCEISVDCLRIVSSSCDGTARVWNSRTGKELFRISGVGRNVWTCSFSSDGSKLLIGGTDGILLCDAINGAIINKLTSHNGDVRTCSFSPDNKMFLSGSDDCTIKIWESNTGNELITLVGHKLSVKKCLFSYDCKFIISSDLLGHLGYWCLNDNPSFNTISKDISISGKTWSVTYNDKLFFCDNRGRWNVWDISKKEIIDIIYPEKLITCLTITPDGNLVLASNYNHQIMVMDPNNGNIIDEKGYHQDDIRGLSVASNLEWAISASDDRKIKMWNLSVSGNKGIKYSPFLRPLNCFS